MAGWAEKAVMVQELALAEQAGMASPRRASSTLRDLFAIVRKLFAVQRLLCVALVLLP